MGLARAPARLVLLLARLVRLALRHLVRLALRHLVRRHLVSLRTVQRRWWMAGTACG